MELIDEGLLHTYDKAIESYVGAKEEIGPAKAAIIALLNSYSSKRSANDKIVVPIKVLLSNGMLW